MAEITINPCSEIPMKCYGCGSTPCSTPATCNAMMESMFEKSMQKQSLIEVMKTYQLKYMMTMKKAEQIKPVYSSYRGAIFNLGEPAIMRLGNIVFEAHKDYLKATLKFMNL